MLTIAENKRLSAAAILATVLLLLVGFTAGRLSQPAPAPAAPSQASHVAALQAQLTRLHSAQSAAHTQLLALQSVQQHDTRLQAANRRLTAQLGAVRACMSSHRPRACLRRALR